MLSNGFYLAGPEWVKNWYSLSLTWSDTNPAYVMYPNSSVSRLLKKAHENRDVFNLTLFIAGTRLKEGIDLNEDLRGFVSNVLLGIAEIPKAPSGRPAKNTWGRDYIVYRVMSDLELSLGLAMGQNVQRDDDKEHKTSCSEIVEAAIARTGMQN